MRLLLVLNLLLSLLYAENIRDAISGGKLVGNVTLFSYDIDRESGTDAYATSFGGFIKYTTDAENPLFASIRFDQSSSIGPSKNRLHTGLFDDDNNGSNLTALTEAFLSYQKRGVLLKAGNMLLNTPMMNDDTTRMIPWSYQGLSFTSEPFPDTKLQLSHISQIRSHTSSEYKKESASGEFKRGISMIGLINEALEETSIQAYYYYAPDLYSTLTAQIDHKHLLSEEFLFCLGLQYYKSGDGGKYNNTLSRDGGDDIDLIALNLGIDGPAYEVSLNYSRNFGLSGIIRGYGGLAKVYTTSMIANGRGNFKPETWMLKSHFDIDPLSHGQSEFAIWLTHTRVHDVRGEAFNAFYTHLRHYFNARTSLYLRFESIDYHKGVREDVNHLRLIASFDF